VSRALVGCKGAINKILAHNGCILAGSVGLGKTFEALAVMKFFETRNERALVLYPKKLPAWARQKPEARTVSALLDRLGSDFFKLLDALTISRSRRHIERYYKDSLKELGGFPTRTKLGSIYPELDAKNPFMNYDRLNDEISRYKLCCSIPLSSLSLNTGRNTRERWETSRSPSVRTSSSG
jgi:hypothetical protein